MFFVYLSLKIKRDISKNIPLKLMYYTAYSPQSITATLTKAESAELYCKISPSAIEVIVTSE
jgi:hypothetical protein